MITRRKAVRVLGSASVGVWLARASLAIDSSPAARILGAAKDESTPTLAPSSPTSPERISLIDAFKKRSEGLEKKFEARTLKRDWTMPYRLFRPQATGKMPLVVYLHGSGGQGDDNLKQLGLGNIFGTRVWLLPENQKRFPCYVLAPQSNRGWAKYDFEQQPAKLLAGFGDGNRLAAEIIDRLCKEFPIDTNRIYITGQSMGGGGTWNMLANRPKRFAAAVPVCGSITLDDGTGAIDVPVWNFHGD